MKISNTPPSFLKQLPYFTKPCLFMGKSKFPLFAKILKTQPLSLKDGGGGFPTMKRFINTVATEGLENIKI